MAKKKFIGKFRGKYDEGIEGIFEFDYNQVVTLNGKLCYSGKFNGKKAAYVEV